MCEVWDLDIGVVGILEADRAGEECNCGGVVVREEDSLLRLWSGCIYCRVGSFGGGTWECFPCCSLFD